MSFDMLFFLSIIVYITPIFIVILLAHPINIGGLLIITSQESCKDQPGRLYTSLAM